MCALLIGVVGSIWVKGLVQEPYPPTYCIILDNMSIKKKINVSIITNLTMCIDEINKIVNP